MKTIKASSRLRFIVLGLAISMGIISLQPANAQSSQKRLAEIGWSSRLSSMGIDREKNIGRTYDFYCQAATEDLVHAPIWGTNIYTANSGICSTAVHSGMISKEGGIISIELLEGQEFYTGSKKNGLESKDHVGTKLSYTFMGEAVTNNYTESETNQKRRPSTIERVMVNSVQRGVERSIERIITDIFD